MEGYAKAYYSFRIKNSVHIFEDDVQHFVSEIIMKGMLLLECNFSSLISFLILVSDQMPAFFTGQKMSYI